MNLTDFHNQFWCTEHEEIVSLAHSNDDCDANDHYEITAIVDGQPVAKPGDMGHLSPHVWIDVDGLEQCAECEAIKIPDDAVDSYYNRA